MPRKLTPSEVRSKVVEEILNTERDYVKHLEDIIEVSKGLNNSVNKELINRLVCVQGFLKKCRVNTKLFDQEKVETIFSNLERLYQFQLEFLGQLEARISQRLEDSQIGEVFVACVSHQCVCVSPDKISLSSLCRGKGLRCTQSTVTIILTQ